MAVSDIIIRLKTMGAEMSEKSLNKVSRALERMRNNSLAARISGRQFSKTMDQMSRSVLSWGLGLLFFGMMLKRFFQGILTTTVDFYKKTTEGQTEASQGLTRLAASWQFLKFSVGEAIATALLPLIPLLTDIVDKFSNWVQENPKLIAGIVLFGLVMGTALMILGQMALGLTSVVNLFSKLVAMGTSASLNLGLVILAFVALGAIVAGFFSEWNTLFGDGKKAPISLGDALKVLAEIGIRVFKALFIGGKLIAIGLRNVFDALVIDVQFAMATVIKSVERLLNFAIRSINMVISAMNRVPGVNIRAIGSVDFGSADALFSDIERRAAEASQRSVDLLRQTEPLLSGESSFGGSQVTINEVTVNTRENEDLILSILEEIQRRAGPTQQII